MYLAAAGIGTLGIVDFDVVDASNLHRQIIYGTPDVGRRKLEASRERIAALNPGVKVVTARDRADVEERARHPARLRRRPRRHGQFPDALSRQRRVRAARQAERLREHLPLRRPGVGVRRQGRARAIAASIRSRRRPGLVPSCAEGGVLGVLPGVIGIIQATEAIKLILGAGQPLVGRLLLYDALADAFSRAEAAARSRVPGLRRSPDHHGAHRLRRSSAASLPPQAQPAAAGVPEVTAEELKAQLRSRRGRVRARRPRAERVSDLPDRRIEADSARRARQRAPPSSIAIARWSSTARWAAAARRPSRCCRSAASHACAT